MVRSLLSALLATAALGAAVGSSNSRSGSNSVVGANAQHSFATQSPSPSPPPHPPAPTKPTFAFSQTETLATITEVNFDWSGSPWATRDDAIAAGVFYPHHNIVTGVNRYGDDTFLTVPRWKTGVPSTLNTLAFESDGIQTIAVLKPWPSWEMNINDFKYVQSVYIDHGAQEMWIIDTGRQYFFNEEAVVNRAASLYIMNLANKTIVKNVSFPDAIFSFTNSFLNDIVVDTVRQVAYMTDTNIAGFGAVVAYRRSDDAVIRFEDPSSTYANASFVVEVDGVAYPSMASPADGIALSGDAARLFYSAVDGNTIYSLNTSYLRTALDDAAHFVPSSLFDKVSKAFFRDTASDGMVWLPTDGYGDVAFGKFTSPTGVNVFSDSHFTDGTGAPVTHTNISAAAPWVDSFALYPWYTVADMCANVDCDAIELETGLPAALPTVPIPPSKANCDPSDMIPVPLPPVVTTVAAEVVRRAFAGLAADDVTNVTVTDDKATTTADVRTTDVQSSSTDETTKTEVPPTTPAPTTEATTSALPTTAVPTTTDAPTTTAATTTVVPTTAAPTTTTPAPTVMVCPNLFSGPGSKGHKVLYGFSLYFTTNRLQEFFNGTMDFHNRTHHNMIVYRTNYAYASSTPGPVRPATEMKMALGFLGAVGFLSLVTVVILVVARMSRGREGMQLQEDVYRRYVEQQSRRTFNSRR